MESDPARAAGAQAGAGSTTVIGTSTLPFVAREYGQTAVRALDELLGHLAIDTGHRHLELGHQLEVLSAEAGRAGDRRAGDVDLALGRDDDERVVEARRVAAGEQLLGVREVGLGVAAELGQWPGLEVQVPARGRDPPRATAVRGGRRRVDPVHARQATRGDMIRAACSR